MRSHIVPLLQRTAGQAVGSAAVQNSAAAAELQGTLRSLLQTVPSFRSLSAAAASEEASVQQQQAVTADASAHSDQHAADVTTSSSNQTKGDAAAAAATADQPSSSNSSNGSKKRNGQHYTPRTRHPQAEQFLTDVGLGLEGPQHISLSKPLKHRLARLRSHTTALLDNPSAFMAVACINGLQLQTLVAPVADSASELHPLEYSEEWVERQHSMKRQQQQEQQRRQQPQQQAGKQPAGADSSSSSGSNGSEARASSAKQQQQQLGPARHEFGSSSSSSSSRSYNAYQQQRQQAAAESLTRLRDKSKSSLWDVQLSPDNLVPENSSDLMVNLNVQMINARAGDQGVTAGHRAVVGLFDQLLDQGIKAALEQEQQGKPLLLPEQYRPDHTAFVTYCKSVGRLSEIAATRIREHQQPFQPHRPGVDRWGTASESERRLQLQQAKEQGKLLAQGISRVCQLWDPSRDSSRGGQAKMGAQLHIAQMAALRAAGRHKDALEYWEGLRPRLQPDLLSSFWRLHFYATASALAAGDLEAADRYALVFSDKVNGTGFRREDYVNVIGPLVVELVNALAKARMWDQAVYWLQQLINHDPLRPVEPCSFLIMLQESANGGRLDLARVMLSALDDTLKIQGHPPYVYSEFQCMDLMRGAAQSGDLPFIELVWDRLSQDVQRDARGNSDRRRGRLNVSSDIVQEISGGVTTAGDEAINGSSSDEGRSKAVTKHPSKDAYAAAVTAFVECEAYGKAFEFLHSMGQLFGDVPVCSVYQGVRCFPESLVTEAKIAAAFSQLKARKDAGQPITTTMLNVLTRAIARSSDTTTVGKVFNAYEPTWGLQPDVDTYNAVLEACESAGKVGAVQGMLSLMASRGVAPNTVSWNLLLSTCIRAGDGKAVVSALNRMREAGIEPSAKLLEDAINLSYSHKDSGLRAVIRQVATNQLSAHHPVMKRLNGGGGKWGVYTAPAGGGDGGGRQRGAAAGGMVDAWTPGGSSSSSGGGRGGSGRGRGEDGEEQRQQAANA